LWKSVRATLYQKVKKKIQLLGGRVPTPVHRLARYFARPSGPTCPLAKFHVNRFNETPLRSENADFWPLSKNNTGSLPLGGNPAGNKLKESFTTPVHGQC